MALVAGSFVAANLNYPGAVKLWNESAESLFVFLGLGLGLKMGKDVVQNYVTKKFTANGSNGSGATTNGAH